MFLIVAALFAAVSFNACSDDDDNNVDAGSIVGTWKFMREVGYEIVDGDREDFDDMINDDIRYIFNENGTGRISRQSAYKNDDESFTWSMSGNQLTMTRKMANTYTVKKLTSTEMVLHYYYKGIIEDNSEGNIEYESDYMEYYKRVN